MKKQKQKVLVAMSGGVDSSVAAALLLRDGYQVTGAFMRQTSASSVEPWSEEGIKTVCTWKKDRRDALRVAAKLGMPLITMDFEKEYKELVIKYMFDEYKAGRTPNPDVLCNKHIKFGVWLDAAKQLGYDYLATGHYAQITKTQKHKNTKTQYLLLQAKDKNKDQTYFLHQLNQKQLARALFPIGKYLKSEVRSLARRFDLPTAEREESMGICFVGEVPMKEFLQTRITQKRGKITLTDGTVVGEHEGLAFYTIGQRHFGMQNAVTASHRQWAGSRSGGDGRDPAQGGKFKMQKGDMKPLFVVEKRMKSNELVVGYEDDPALYRQEVVVGGVNWIAGQPPKFPLQCRVRLRHRQPMQVAEIRNWPACAGRKLEIVGERVTVYFKKPQKAVTPGQFAVFYRAEECLGGGVIQ